MQLDELKNKFEDKELVRVTDLSDFTLFVTDQRKLDPQSTEALLNIDKGGEVLKTTLTLKQENEVEGEPLSTGVKKSSKLTIWSQCVRTALRW